VRLIFEYLTAPSFLRNFDITNSKVTELTCRQPKSWHE